MTAANLTWGTSGSENAAYIVYRNDVQIATTTQMSYTDTELPVNMLFKYCVSAVDEAGNISKWAEIYLRTARHAIPGRIEAELFCASGGTGIKSTSDGGGSRILAFIGPGDWALYDVNRAVSGKYRVEMRLATAIDTENRDSTSIILISTRQLLSPNQPPEWPGRVQFRKPLA